MPSLKRALASAEAQFVTFPQCALGAPTQKFTTIAFAPSLAAGLAELQSLRCEHTGEGHESVAYGYDALGRSRSALAAAYPSRMNELLARAFIEASEQFVSPPIPADVSSQGGRVELGPELGAFVRQQIVAARLHPARFTSFRNRRAVSPSRVRLEALPEGPSEPPPPSKPPRARRPKGAAFPDAQRRNAVSAAESFSEGEDPAVRPPGPIAVAQLFLPGVYESVVLPWQERAQEAASACAARLRGGQQRVPVVPTITLRQERMPSWARGIVWDCSDPTDCAPVQRSTRYTPFPGKRQLNRVAFRAAAAALQWQDDDIVQQAGEGGVEPRSNCELLTVLTFHHAGLLEQLDSAEGVVRAHQEEEWVSQGTTHLPFVPCRIQPRNVVMQERVRLVPAPGGVGDSHGFSAEDYLKPRVTTNSSFGAAEAVNAGVPEHERTLWLPTAQLLGRALAICGQAGRSSEAVLARATPYVVDAESAFSFCPIQHADLWTQVFVWWTTDGSLRFCIDRRMGFGGAFAPNRFERISTLVAAHVEALQRDFDSSHPFPACVQGWRCERERAQQNGCIPADERQLEPRYLQIFIDDLTGVGLDDPVTPPESVAHIVIDPAATIAAGGQPAPQGTRVHVYAQLAVLGLSQLGLSAAPGKVIVGNPAVALGLLIHGEADRILCPAKKRDTMLADIGRQRSEAVASGTAECKRVRALVGRLSNISQILPELKPFLHAGYAVGSASWVVRGIRRFPKSISFGPDTPIKRGWLQLLDAAESSLQRNEGVPLAPELVFPAADGRTCIECTTDASGDDGFGGYAFLRGADDEWELWLVSEPWQPDVLEARRHADRERCVREQLEQEAGRALPALSITAAELFAAWAVACAVRLASGVPFSAIISIGDNDGTAADLNSLSAGTPQLRLLVESVMASHDVWLGVSVPRDANSDADVLSHPLRWREVADRAQAAGFRVCTASVPASCWEVLSAAAALGVGTPALKVGRKRSRHSLTTA